MGTPWHAIRGAAARGADHREPGTGSITESRSAARSAGPGLASSVRDRIVDVPGLRARLREPKPVARVRAAARPGRALHRYRPRGPGRLRRGARRSARPRAAACPAREDPHRAPGPDELRGVHAPPALAERARRAGIATGQPA